jgi:hypothetical protein
VPTCLQVKNGGQIPPLNIRDAGEKYECDTVAELRPARIAIAIGLSMGARLIAAAIRLCTLKCLSECQLRLSYLEAEGTAPESGLSESRLFPVLFKSEGSRQPPGNAAITGGCRMERHRLPRREKGVSAAGSDSEGG